jgi:transposase
LVFWKSELLGTPESELGIKGKSGIIKNMETQAAYLANLDHPAYFVYTPKHCSWLNQIEIWFSILSKKNLHQDNFISIQNLK